MIHYHHCGACFQDETYPELYDILDWTKHIVKEDSPPEDFYELVVLGVVQPCIHGFLSLTGYSYLAVSNAVARRGGGRLGLRPRPLPGYGIVPGFEKQQLTFIFLSFATAQFGFL